METSRRLHRWIGTAGMVLFTWLALTGTVTALYQLRFPPEPFVAQGAGHAGAELPASAAWPAMVRTVTRAALATRADRGPRTLSIQLRMSAGRAVGTVLFDGDMRHPATYDAVTGRRLASDRRVPPGPGLGRVLVALHSGAILAGPGQLVIAATGAFAVLLVTTGAILYSTMWARRRRNGMGRLFW